MYRGLPLHSHLPSLAFLAKSLADENRLRILLALGNGKKAVTHLVEELQLSQPLVSHHLKELKRSLLVKVERRGPFVFYEVADPRIMGILAGLAELVQDLLANRKTF
ncbi:MAG: helix-turn-helix transcriptional regulator [Deltaproteobacteria bacterium]|nr:helix-turn-helix transcriptional regulator [Deltaproteobacteria bacterium]